MSLKCMIEHQTLSCVLHLRCLISEFSDEHRISSFMSRIIVKGLPSYCDEAKLRDHFLKQGNVTDVKLMKKRNGESRRFAFVGYKSIDDAEKAAKYFHQSFMDTARIHVELAKTFSDPTVPLSFREQQRIKQNRLQEQEERLLQQQLFKRQKTKSQIDKEIENNPKLQEFMEVMRPSHEVKSWANDAVFNEGGAPSAKELERALEAQEKGDNVSVKPNKVPDVVHTEGSKSDDEYDDFPKFDEVEDDEEDEEMIPLNNINDDQREDSSETAANQEMSDLDWLRQRQTRIKENGDKADPAKTTEEPDTADSNIEVQETKQEESPSEKIAKTGRLFVRNILYTSTEEEFRTLFQKYGSLEEVHIAVDTRTGKSKGFVYVQFKQPKDAVEAYKSLDKQIFQGRLLHILPAEAKKDHRLDEFDIKNLPLKKQRDLKKKAQAAKSQFSWNSLYMNSDAVLESVAAKMGVSKSDLIDAESSSSGVKQALAEAHVIGDVRKYFESKGVDLTSFSKKERDDKIVLVKNFPYGTGVNELNEIFGQYGPIKRTLMPPAGTIAVIEFQDAPSARAAFTKLAYRKFNNSILYLEKGPKGLFIREPVTSEVVEVEKEKVEQGIEPKVTANSLISNDAKDETEIEGPTVSVFVKNLNFSTTQPQLASVFEKLPGFALAIIKTKPDPKKSGATLSMGFGFVEFKSKEEAEAAISALNDYVLDGHKLQLKLSHRQGGQSKGGASKTNKTNKIIIKNLPFEATRKDVLELFGAFGQLKSVRVPKKFDKSARGFAFVEFVLLKEAENAMDQLEGVHLLGRRLVMQYAEKDAEDAEAEIAKMTKKVKNQVATQELAAARLAGKGKRNIDLDEDDEEM